MYREIRKLLNQSVPNSDLASQVDKNSIMTDMFKFYRDTQKEKVRTSQIRANSGKHRVNSDFSQNVISESQLDKITKNFKGKIRNWKLSQKTLNLKLSRADIENLSNRIENRLLQMVEQNSDERKRRLIKIRIRRGENNLVKMRDKIFRQKKRKKYFNSQHELRKSLGSKNIKFSQGMKPREGENSLQVSSNPQSKNHFSSSSQRSLTRKPERFRFWVRF